MSSKNVIDLRKRDQGQGQRPAPKAPPQREQLRLTPERQAPRLQADRSSRVSPVRTRRRRARYTTLGVVVVILAILIYGVSWVSYLPRYNVSAVSIVGTDAVPSSDVSDYVEGLLHTPGHPFLSRDNIFLYDPKAIARAVVANFPRIASATVSRASLFSTAVTVSVTERESYALWCSDDTHTDCYQMDKTGFIFVQATAPVVSLSSTASSTATSTPVVANTTANDSEYIFQGGLGTMTDATSSDASSTPVAISNPSTANNPIGQTFVGAHMPGIVALLQDLGQAGYTPTGATVENGQDFWVPLKPVMPAGGQGFYIKASFGEDPGSIVSNLQLVLASDALSGKENQLEYVDLRFGDRVYYKLQGSTETQSSN